MHTTAKKNKASCTPLLFTVTSILPKKSIKVHDEPASNVDFHLEIIRQIDALLKEKHTPVPPQPPQVPDHIHFSAPGIEQRGPIACHPAREDITFDPTAPLHRPRPIPEEFKTDFPDGTRPAFRFVTQLDPLDDLGLMKPRDDRVEIIDLASLRVKDITTSTQFPSPKTPATTPHHTHADIAFLTAMADADNQGTERSQLYYLQSKSYKDKKAEKEDRELSYLPVDLSERVQQIKEQEQEEEEKQRLEQEKQRKRDEKDQRKQQKKTDQPTPQPQTLPETKPTPPKRKTKTSKPTSPADEPEPQPLTKKQQKLAARQAKLEERKQKHLAKLQEKEQKKQEKQHLKEQHNKHAKTKTTKPAKTKEKHSLFKKNTTTLESLEIDNDLLKFLQLTDTLLGQLPDDVIDQFAHSDDFQLYEKIMAKYHVK